MNGNRLRAETKREDRKFQALKMTMNKKSEGLPRRLSKQAPGDGAAEAAHRVRGQRDLAGVGVGDLQ